MPLRTDCYLAVLKRFKVKYPTAIFELVHRASGSVLAPSVDLLIRTGIFAKADGSKNPKDFVLYRRLYREQILTNKMAMQRLRELKQMAERQDIFLVCLEKDPTNCHRTLIKEMIEELPDEQR